MSRLEEQKWLQTDHETKNPYGNWHEFIPGGYKGVYSNPESVFLGPDEYDLVWGVICGSAADRTYDQECERLYGEMCVVTLDRYSWMEVMSYLREQRKKVASCGTFREAAKTIPDAATYLFERNTSLMFQRYVEMLDDLSIWLEKTIKTHDIISVLGYP
ncbi:MAG: hypothetical protein RQ754_14150 [Desulfuromonadales bacterium]|nr:hypothetical protein [Desulfuromonadales bacterium]